MNQLEKVGGYNRIEFNFEGTFNIQSQEAYQAAQEADLEILCEFLETDIKDGQIKFRVFDNLSTKTQEDPMHSGSRASARFNEMTVYRYWKEEDDPHFPHEMTHLIAHTWGEPYLLCEEQLHEDGIEMLSTSFMQEGLAIAIDELAFQRGFFGEGRALFGDEICRNRIDDCPKSLREIVNLDGFCQFDNEIGQAFGASLSKYLLQEYGLDAYKQMYAMIKETQTPAENTSNIEEIYGMRESELLEKWREQL